MKYTVFRLYAGLLLIIFYLPLHIELQIREIARAYRNWKPKNTIKHGHDEWISYWTKNVRTKP